MTNVATILDYGYSFCSFDYIYDGEYNNFCSSYGGGSGPMEQLMLQTLTELSPGLVSPSMQPALANVVSDMKATNKVRTPSEDHQLTPCLRSRRARPRRTRPPTA